MRRITILVASLIFYLFAFTSVVHGYSCSSFDCDPDSYKCVAGGCTINCTGVPAGCDDQAICDKIQMRVQTTARSRVQVERMPATTDAAV